MHKIPDQKFPLVAADHPILRGFVVLEGIDGAGKTYQSHQLKAVLEKNQARIIMTSEPSQGTIGQQIRRLLAAQESVSWQQYAHLFARDRHAHLFAPKGIIHQCSQGAMVICDRYLFSSLAYQGAFLGLDTVWQLNREFPLPEYLFFLDIPLQISQNRRMHRSLRQNSESDQTLEKVQRQYQQVLQMFAHTQMQIHRIDGHLPPKEVSQHISQALQSADI